LTSQFAYNHAESLTGFLTVHFTLGTTSLLSWLAGCFTNNYTGGLAELLTVPSLAMALATPYKTV
jgi:hypothetical protein